MHQWLYKMFANQSQDRADNHTKKLIVGLFWGVITIIIAAVILLIVDYAGHKRGWAKLGTFGDFFGGVFNPILTLFTLIGLAVTIIMQRSSLSTSRTQAFETTFFNMLDLHNKVVQDLRFDPALIPLATSEARMRQFANLPAPTFPVSEGREVFRRVLISIKNAARDGAKEVEIYRSLQVNHNYVLGHYFRNLYQILRLIDNFATELNDGTTAQVYASIIRAQLSTNELSLLFYNCLDGMVDKGKFLFLVKQYRLLEHLPLEHDPKTNTLRGQDLPDDGALYEQYFVIEPAKEHKLFLRGAKIIKPGAFGTNPAVAKFIEHKALAIP